MQVNNKEQAGMGQEIKKRADGEWGTLPANAINSRNDLQADNSGQYS